MALTVLKNDKITKRSMNLKRLKAGWDENYLQHFYRQAHFNASALSDVLHTKYVCSY